MPPPRSRAAKLPGAPGSWQGQTSRRRTLTGTAPNSERKVAREWPLLAGICPQAEHHRRRSPTVATCADTISAWSAAVSRFASSSRSPRSARPASSSRSIRATSVSVATPGSGSATSLTRHTSFGTSPRSPASQEPTGAGTQGPAPKDLHALRSSRSSASWSGSSFFNGWRARPGTIPATSQLDWLISMTAISVLSWCRATRDPLRSSGRGMGRLHPLASSADGAPHPAPPHSFCISPRTPAPAGSSPRR